MGRRTHAAVRRTARRPAAARRGLPVRARPVGGQRPSTTSTKTLAKLLADEHVPYLPADRYKPAGLRKRAQWERTWALQRREDKEGVKLDIPVPPKYTSADFAKAVLLAGAGQAGRPQGAVHLVPATGPGHRRLGAARLGRVGPPDAGPGAGHRLP